MPASDKGDGMAAPLPHRARTGYAEGPQEKPFISFADVDNAFSPEQITALSAG